MMDPSDNSRRGADLRKRASAAPAARPDNSSHFRLGVGVMAVLATVALLLFGPRAGARFAQQRALSHMSRQEITLAQGWLARSAWLAPGDYATDLLKAACYRQLSQTEAWRKCLDEAVRKQAPQDRIALELQLDRMRHGAVSPGAEAEIGKLSQAGVPPNDAAAAALFGYLEQRDAAAARAFLERMPADFADEAQREYLWGIFLRKQEQQDAAGAQVRFTNALDKRPGHELARVELAGLLEEQCELDRALQAYAELGVHCGASETATLGLARVLRKLGRLEQSQAVLAGLASQRQPSAPAQLEAAQVALESGNYEEAERGFGRMPLDGTVDSAILVPASHTLALRKKPLDAQRLFIKALDQQRRDSWIFELRVRVSIHRENVAAAEELQRLIKTSAPLVFHSWDDAPTQIATERIDKSAAAELHRVHCSVCHGLKGDGRGIAAQHLFPRPRDLRTGPYQLVSTLNGVPTREDVEQVLARGMPGASMPSFPDLPEADRRLLAEEVLRLRREGAREQMVQAFRQEGEDVDEADVRRAVELVTTPGERVRLPVQWPAQGQAALQGRASYSALGCNKCHGDDGAGAADQALFDGLGEPSRPRDLVHEAFKGGREPEAIYARIAAGMPGTAHPAAFNQPQAQLVELVDFVRSLAREPEGKFANHERRTRADRLHEK